MAVEAQHLNLFSPQILCSRNTMMNVMEGTGNLFSSNGIDYGTAAATPTTMEGTIPMYGAAMTESVQAKTPATMKTTDSGLTYALPPPLGAAAAALSRKRSRDDNPLLSFAPQNCNQHHSSSVCPGVSSFTFLGADVSFQIQQQQLEIDRLIAEHNEKVRMEIEERRKRNSRRLIAAVEESVMKKLKAKEEEIEKINKLNWALEERVKTLCIENQMWRDLAQMNEATGNALRSNLEQVLSERRQQGGDAVAAEALDDDAQSCCGSNFDAEIDRRTITNGAAEINHFWRTLADGAAESKGEWRTLAASNAKSKGVVKRLNCKGNDGCVNGAGNGNGKAGNINRFCRSCGKEESCVLLLPCRHLCLCTVCGSSLHVCPICKSTKTASLHVNF